MLFTVGHSTRTAEDFLGLIRSYDVGLVADVRAFPGSRRHPQFGSDLMAQWLADAGIGYQHFRDLGGRRRETGAPAELNAGWRVASFRHYADWTLSPQWGAALETLSRAARDARTAVMCSEALPWRCHRQLIATVLVVQGWTVQHILDGGLREHVLGEFGPPPFVQAGQVTYPPQP